LKKLENFWSRKCIKDDEAFFKIKSYRCRILMIGLTSFSGENKAITALASATAVFIANNQ
jgi:hypothetical protein